jgi:hypothetical protein
MKIGIRAAVLAAATCLAAASASACPDEVRAYGSEIPARSGAVTIAFPDVCKTPRSVGPVPIPYPNFRTVDPGDRGGHAGRKIKIRPEAGWDIPEVRHPRQARDPAPGRPYPAWNEGDGLYHTMPVGEPELIDPEQRR